jgi:ATP synthase protein I
VKSNFRALVIRRLIAIQLGLTLVIALISLSIGGVKAFASATLGGLVCLLPNLFFAWLVFKYQGARRAKKIVHTFYKAEAIKTILTIVLFAIVFIMFDIVPLAFFISYLVVQMSHWFAPWYLNNSKNRSKSD